MNFCITGNIKKIVGFENNMIGTSEPKWLKNHFRINNFDKIEKESATMFGDFHHYIKYKVWKKVNRENKLIMNTSTVENYVHTLPAGTGINL